MSENLHNSPATEDMLADLHVGITERFKTILEADGDIKAAELEVIRKFLKDNNITAEAAVGTPLEAVVNALPFKESA